jgi:pyrimidine 5'-nucleotidase
MAMMNQRASLAKREAIAARASRSAPDERRRRECARAAKPRRSQASSIWLFDLDDTLHDASHAAFGELHVAMGAYVAGHLGIDEEQAARLRERYWLRYGATLLGLVRHHGVHAAHFLAETHRLPGLEERVRTSAHDRAALARLPGRKLIVTNAPRGYAMRVLRTLRLVRHVDGVITIEDMTMFGALRPKRTRACCAASRRGSACRRGAACSSRTRSPTSRRRARSACGRCGCSATSADVSAGRGATSRTPARSRRRRCAAVARSQRTCVPKSARFATWHACR